MPITFDSPQAILDAVGQDLGHTDWMTMTQERVQRFADATDDQQWIHVDEARAAQGPFGACIAHGYLSLSLAARFMPELVRWQGVTMGINYGCDKVRFPAPVKVGSLIRGHAVLSTAQMVADSVVQVGIRLTVQIQGSDKPACVVDTLSRLVFGPGPASARHA
ncbi:MAG: MaoC family dehydratase [Rubrivivax sp.]|jgi:acyl dehydratase|nr:MaoC family dehydratase [Rubrivivax sp.]